MSNGTHSILSALDPSRWTGPIFTKELRVTSRRWRHYGIRTAYILLMLLFLTLLGFWKENTSGADAIQRGAEMGKWLIVTAAWVQFVALQLVALVLACTAINEEIYSRSLGVLMSTPVTSFQIVLGKVASKMLQIVILLAISLPVLAILRVFGGVPLEFVIASSCITFTACLFAASLGIFYSTFIRRAYAVILLSMLTLVVLYGIVAWALSIVFFLLMMAFRGAWSGAEGIFMMAQTAANPFMAMGLLTVGMWQPSARFMFSWEIHCLVMAGLSIGLLAITIPMVRRRALRSAIGSTPMMATTLVMVPAMVPVMPLPLTPAETPGPQPRGESNLLEGGSGPVPPPIVTLETLPIPEPAALEDIVEGMVEARRLAAQHYVRAADQGLAAASDNPVFWRERRIPLIQSRTWRIALLVTSLVVLGLLYLGMLALARFDAATFVSYPFCVLYVFCAVGCMVVVTATPITAEKESGTMSLLLATTLSDWQILLGKAGGALRRSLPIWLFLVGHCVAFSVFLQLHPLVIPLVLIQAIGVATLLVGSGLFFSACFRKTTASVVANIGLALTIWVLVPLLLWPESWIADPVVQIVEIVRWSTEARPLGSENGDAYIYWFGLHLNGLSLTVLTSVISGIHSLLGVGFFLAAKRVLRRNVF